MHGTLSTDDTQLTLWFLLLLLLTNKHETINNTLLNAP